MKTVRLIDLVKEIKGNKNITNTNIIRVIRAIPKVIIKMLMNKTEIKLTSFLKLGFRNAKDRMLKSSTTNETLHMPEHIRFKATFYEEFKTFINKNQENLYEKH